MAGIFIAFFSTSAPAVVTINTIVTGLSDAPIGTVGFCG